jgi:F-type H+-transporting ATPase subunit epsilon
MAAGNTFHLVIASVGETRFDGAAASATLPGTDGELTVLPNHEPFITTLKPGFIRVKLADGDVRDFPIESGVLECTGERAVVLL